MYAPFGVELDEESFPADDLDALCRLCRGWYFHFGGRRRWRAHLSPERSAALCERLGPAAEALADSSNLRAYPRHPLIERLERLRGCCELCKPLGMKLPLRSALRHTSDVAQH